MAKPYDIKRAHEYLSAALDDLSIIAGDKVGPGDASWQDVAGTAAVNLRCLAAALDEARKGNVKDGPVVFPSPAECMARAEGTED